MNPAELRDIGTNATLYRALPVGSDRRVMYFRRIVENVPRILSHLDREIFSPTYGSFDRLFWAWSATDVSNVDAQRLVLPLSLAYRYTSAGVAHAYHGHELLLHGVEAALRFLVREQHANGSFDQWYPNDYSVVSAGFVFHDVLLAMDLLGDSMDEALRAQVLEAATRAATFLLTYEEKHGFNSNHQLGIAAALFGVSKQTGNGVIEERARLIVARVLARQLRSGAFFEYAGADPGYNTLGLAYLTACVRYTGDEVMRCALQAGLDFERHFLSDASGCGGCYGSRGSKLLFPSSFEFAATQGYGADLAALVARIIEHGASVTERTTDIHNLPPILSDYARAFLYADEPMQQAWQVDNYQRTSFYCEQSTLFSYPVGQGHMRGRLNGGMVQIECGDRQVFASAGYMVQGAKTLAFTGVLDGCAQRDAAGMTFHAEAQKTNRMRQTPFMFLGLRLFQFTLGRFMGPNVLLKWLMARLLIFGKKAVPVRLERRISHEGPRVTIRDTLVNTGHQAVSVRHCADGYISFMGSARYFDEACLPENARGDGIRMMVNGVPQAQGMEADRIWHVAARKTLRLEYTIEVGG